MSVQYFDLYRCESKFCYISSGRKKVSNIHQSDLYGIIISHNNSSKRENTFAFDTCAKCKWFFSKQNKVMNKCNTKWRKKDTNICLQIGFYEQILLDINDIFTICKLFWLRNTLVTFYYYFAKFINWIQCKMFALS